MKILLKSCLLLLLSTSSLDALAQQAHGFEVRGIVRDSVTQETLPFANVFFSSTTFGTTSDREGVFSLKPDAPGTYELVVSFTGYKPFSQQLELTEPGVTELNITMAPEPRFLGNVTVVAKKDRKWRRNLGIFQRVFLGSTRNSIGCTILNEDMLYFEFDEAAGYFEAYASEPLIIENKSLGYKLTYVLENLVIDYNNGYSSFNGYPSFEELEPGENVKKKWIRARDRAYNGSVAHFYQELYKGTTEKAGYTVSRGSMDDGVLNITKDLSFDINTLVSSGGNNRNKELRFNRLLFIEYDNELPEPAYGMSLSNQASPEIRYSNKQISWIEMPEGENGVIFEESGYIVNARSFVLQGYWSFEKVADLIPLNYVPSNRK